MEILSKFQIRWTRTAGDSTGHEGAGFRRPPNSPSTAPITFTDLPP